jgi:hypothetical protein
METEIIVALISSAAVIIAAFIAYKKNDKIKRLQIDKEELQDSINQKNIIIKDREFKISTSDKILNFQAFNLIKDSVDRMFNQTKADRFLILIAVNGVRDFRMISVIFEQHKFSQYKVNAIIRYRDVEIDDAYRQLLRDVEHFGSVDLITDEMEPQLLKDFYTIENVKYSKMRFLHRHHLDAENDIVIYSSAATHKNEPWTHIENAIIKMEYEGSIIHTIREYI